MTQEELNEQLFEAVADNDIKAARRAIEEGADVNAIDEDGWTPLHYAAVEGYTAIAEFLIEAGANVNAKDRGGETPLDKAEFALEQAVNAKDRGGETPLDKAKMNLQNAEETIELLKQHGGV